MEKFKIIFQQVCVFYKCIWKLFEHPQITHKQRVINKHKKKKKKTFHTKTFCLYLHWWFYSAQAVGTSWHNRSIITNCCSNYYVRMKSDSSNSRFYHHKVNKADIYIYIYIYIQILVEQEIFLTELFLSTDVILAREVFHNSSKYSLVTRPSVVFMMWSSTTKNLSNKWIKHVINLQCHTGR